MKFETPPNHFIDSLNSVLTLSCAEVVAELQLRLGAKLTMIISAQTTSDVDDCETSSKMPLTSDMLVAALQAARAIAMRYDDAGARDWFMSGNPGLQMMSPAQYLHRPRSSCECDRVVMCAVQDVSYYPAVAPFTECLIRRVTI